MRLKHSVNAGSLKTEMLLGLIVADSVYQGFGRELVVTSLCDSRHSRTSLHYVGYAADLRIRDIPAGELQDVVCDLRKALTGDYDVVLEADHIHLEYQPKRR